MRETKFKVHIKASNTIHDVTGLHYMGGSVSEVQIFCNSIFMWYSILDVDLMQYTGLKDKNGKEIYEGDVVKCPRLDPILRVVKYVDTRGGFYFVSQSYYASADYILDCEIIGNQFENPELLEAKC